MFEEAEEAEDSELTVDDYENFVDAVNKQTVRVDSEMLEHIALSEDGPDMVKIMLKSPVKSMRIFSKPHGGKGKALDAMLKRARNASEDSKDDGKKPKAAADDKTKVLPPLRGTTADGLDPNTDKWSFDDYEQMRNQTEDNRRSFFA